MLDILVFSGFAFAFYLLFGMLIASVFYACMDWLHLGSNPGIPINPDVGSLKIQLFTLLAWPVIVGALIIMILDKIREKGIKEKVHNGKE